MGFVKIHCHAPLSPEMLKAGPEAGWLWVCGLTYCQSYNTGRHIPTAIVKQFGLRNHKKLAQRLVDVGLWERHEGGFLVVYHPRARFEFAGVVRAAQEQFDRLRHYARKQLGALLSKSNGRCVYCGSEAGPFEVDHVIPLSRGGGNEPRNLVAACRPCNREKRARTAEEFGYPDIHDEATRIQ